MKRKHGRNWTIEFYHKHTGLPYSVCRAELKANNWDLLKVYGLDLQKLGGAIGEALETWGQVVNDLAEAVGKFAETLGRMIGEAFDRAAMLTAKDITEEEAET